MPYVKVQTSASLSADAVARVQSVAHNAIKSVLGKPDPYIAIEVNAGVSLQFGGTTAPSAVCVINSIGYGRNGYASREQLTKQLTDVLAEVAGIPGERVFVGFFDVKGDHWGFNGALLG